MTDARYDAAIDAGRATRWQHTQGERGTGGDGFAKRSRLSENKGAIMLVRLQERFSAATRQIEAL